MFWSVDVFKLFRKCCSFLLFWYVDVFKLFQNFCRSFCFGLLMFSSCFRNILSMLVAILAQVTAPFLLLHSLWCLVMSTALTTLSVGHKDELCRPCVDCGLFTGRFCDGQEFEAAGTPCFAKARLPSETWVDNQRTPLCSQCDWRYEKCHYCRGVRSCAPFPHRCAGEGTDGHQ